MLVYSLVLCAHDMRLVRLHVNENALYSMVELLKKNMYRMTLVEKVLRPFFNSLGYFLQDFYRCRNFMKLFLSSELVGNDIKIPII